MPSEYPQEVVSFYLDDWFVDPATNRIRNGDREIKLEPRVMAVLLYLAKNRGQVVTREQLEQDIWSGVIVGYDSLTTTVNKLRKSLGDDPKHPRYIETLSKRGYRLIADTRLQAQEHTGKAVSANASLAQKRVFRLVLLTVVMITAILLLPPQMTTREPQPHENTLPSIAVLPFKSIAQRPDQEYFTDGITEDLTTDLSKMSGLLVISRRSAFTYKNKEIDARDVGRELNVRYVLQGSARAANDRLRVNAQLVDTETGIELWAERYDRKRDDVFAIQDELRTKIIAALSIVLTNKEKQRIARRYTHSIDAYDSFLKGQSYLVKQTRADTVIARQHFQRAIDSDPGFARAYSGLALAYENEYRFGWSDNPGQTAKLALAKGMQALGLDKESPQTHWVLGTVYLFVSGDHDQAIAMGEATIDIDPNHADGLMLLAVTYAFGGEPDRAIALVEKAKRLNPFYPSQYPSVLGLANLLTGRYDSAITAYEESIAINPVRIQPNVYLVAAYVRSGQMEHARWQADRIRADFPGFDLERWARHQPYRDRTTMAAILADIRQAGL